VEASLPWRGVLVLAETFDPGWTARSGDGEMEVLRVNHAMRGVMLEPGSHRVTFTYRPRTFPTAVALVALAALACLAALVFGGALVPRAAVLLALLAGAPDAIAAAAAAASERASADEAAIAGRRGEAGRILLDAARRTAGGSVAAARLVEEAAVHLAAAGEAGAAIGALRRTAAETPDPPTRHRLAIRAAVLLLESGDAGAALSELATLESLPQPDAARLERELLRARADVWRAAGARGEVRDGLASGARARLDRAWARVRALLARESRKDAVDLLERLGQQIGVDQAECDLWFSGPGSARATLARFERDYRGSPLAARFRCLAADLDWTGRAMPGDLERPGEMRAAPGTQGRTGGGPVRVWLFWTTWDRDSVSAWQDLDRLVRSPPAGVAAARPDGEPPGSGGASGAAYGPPGPTEVTGVCLAEPHRADRVSALLAAHRPSWPQVVPDGGWRSATVRALGLAGRGVPATFVVDRSGRVVRAGATGFHLRLWLVGFPAAHAAISGQGPRPGAGREEGSGR
jgi:hypothetical protein